MSRGAVAWLLLVFSLTLLVQLPASWLVRGFGVSAAGVSGSLWQGQAQQIGPFGPLQWTLQPWRLQGQGALGFQGQAWHVQVRGWPWRWEGEVRPAAAQVTVPAAYRLAGQWQGSVRVQGAWRQCLASDGRLTVTDLALSEPWSLGLGQGRVEVQCRGGWHLLGQLLQPGQHQLDVDADVRGRQAQIAIALQPDAALTPLLRGAQWLGPEATTGQRRVRW